MPEDFIKLIKENNGFEVVLAFRDYVDHYIGGTGDTVWYYIQKNSKAEFWMASMIDGVWTDRHYTKKRKEFVSEEVESGVTINKILEKLYLGQDFIKKDGRKPSVLEKHGIMVEHYVYYFGELAYEISRDYGVTVSYSNIKDVENGFYAREIRTGEAVKRPKT